MRDFIRLVLKYSLISFPIGLVTIFLADSDVNPWITILIFIIGFLVMYSLLLDIGKLFIKNDSTKRKYVIYISIIIGEIIFLLLMSMIFVDGIVNNLLGLIGVVVVFSTIIIMIFDMKRV